MVKKNNSVKKTKG